MSNGTDRKSMDDVLASIRRIVRAEKDPDPEAAGGAGPSRDRAGDEPLELTPDIRADAGSVEPEAIARPTETAWPSPASTSRAMPDREMLRGLIREVLLEELADGDGEDVVRRIIRDELTNGEIGGNISQNVLRLIRSEVAKALEDH